MSDLPHVWRNSERDNITVVYKDKTISYNMVEKDTGEDRMPEMINKSYIGYGPGGIDYYSGWDIIAQKDRDNENRVPTVFRTGEYVEAVYGNRTEIYRENRVYSKGSEGRIYEEMGDDEYETYYRGAGFRRVAP